MKLLKLILVLITSNTMSSCLDLRKCPENILGKYESHNIENSINYLLLNENGTFLHYFKKNNLELTDTGTWKKAENGYCQIELSNWKTYNELGERFETYGSGILFINNDYLDITPDGESSSSFRKTD